jgi:inositol oxygenase
VFKDFFKENPDSTNPRFQSRTGIYEEGGGLDHVQLSWGHDEYIYHVTKDYLPDEALYMLRYHSFYPAHRERDYEFLMNAKDQALFDQVRAFNPYDLYTKSHAKPDAKALRPFYEDLIAEFFPKQLAW